MFLFPNRVYAWSVLDLVEIQLALEQGKHLLLLIIIYISAHKKLLASKQIFNFNGLDGFEIQLAL